MKIRSIWNDAHSSRNRSTGKREDSATRQNKQQREEGEDTVSPEDEYPDNIGLYLAPEIFDEIYKISESTRRSVFDEIRLAIETHIVKFKAEQSHE